MGPPSGGRPERELYKEFANHEKRIIKERFNIKRYIEELYATKDIIKHAMDRENLHIEKSQNDHLI
jgi:hypothetical protein